jgi:hypothetical protein
MRQEIATMETHGFDGFIGYCCEEAPSTSTTAMMPAEQDPLALLLIFAQNLHGTEIPVESYRRFNTKANSKLMIITTTLASPQSIYLSTSLYLSTVDPTSAFERLDSAIVKTFSLRKTHCATVCVNSGLSRKIATAEGCISGYKRPIQVIPSPTLPPLRPTTASSTRITASV